MTTKKNQRTPTQAQQAVRDRFRDAAYYAKQLLENADCKHHYTQRAKENGLRSAYLAAFTEYLHTTPVMTITGTVKSALQLTRHRTQTAAVAAPKPVKTKPVAKRTTSVRKPATRNVLAVCNIPGLSMAVACSGNVTAGKMKAHKSRNGSITFTTSFSFD
jgi:hypothetical protein